MKKCERCFIEKPSNEFYRCSARKDGLQGYCKICHALVTKNNRAPDFNKVQYLKRKNSPKYKEQMRKASRLYRVKNRDLTNKRISEWTKRNPDRHAASQAKRRAVKLIAMPIWANQFFIAEAYHLARLRTKVTEKEWHVDHIIPLQSPIVCGLHTENNLRVILGTTNRIKGNKSWNDMPTEIAGQFEI